MKITKAKIENFKSIQNLEFKFKKYGSSYTTMLLGVNESGKSNILQAMSFFRTPEVEFDYDLYHNLKDFENNPVDLWFDIEFEQKSTCVNELKKLVGNSELLDFQIVNIVKNIYLTSDSKLFQEEYDFEILKLSDGLYVSETHEDITKPDGSQDQVSRFTISTPETEGSQALTPEICSKLFGGMIIDIIKRYEPQVINWKPSEEYLISDENLIEFSNNISSRPALRNIFLLAGYGTNESIQGVIANVSKGQSRSILKSKIEDSINEYVKNAWNHSIDIVIDITETGQFTMSIKDTGENNKHDRHSIKGRSEGARHFLSLILSLAIDSSHDRRTNQLILIDEPEIHLHPSGVRDLSKQLLKIGQKNWLFVSTHSPFLIDKKTKDRHIIIKKDKSAITNKVHIDKYTSVIDDEVLQEAFGLQVYRDLLNPHSILVEGASDKQIIVKALEMVGLQSVGITNGHGSNIDTLASKLSDVDISILVILDDDRDGKEYKKKILKIKGPYTNKNVVTIRDLVGSIVDGGTIEDSLDPAYVESQFKHIYKQHFKEKDCDLTIVADEPVVGQMKKYLSTNGKHKEAADFIEQLKVGISENFLPTKGSFNTKSPMLALLASAIAAKLKAD